MISFYTERPVKNSRGTFQKYFQLGYGEDKISVLKRIFL